ncbi:uncharacterized protein LOC103271547, partial [Carlito syrichta]|uniref:Uncharacterized protein LOC103271547 n=1 Tax=Carlito syrichta TaxID=1868482 RepID=A0A3Q0EHJ8_CARSF
MLSVLAKSRTYGILSATAGAKHADYFSRRLAGFTPVGAAARALLLCRHGPGAAGPGTMCDGALLPPLVLPLLLLLLWGLDPGAGWPHPAWAGAGTNPAPQQLPGTLQWTRASDQAQMVLDTQPSSQGPDTWAALQGSN